MTLSLDKYDILRDANIWHEKTICKNKIVVLQAHPKKLKDANLNLVQLLNKPGKHTKKSNTNNNNKK